MGVLEAILRYYDRVAGHATLQRPCTMAMTTTKTEHVQS